MSAFRASSTLLVAAVVAAWCLSCARASDPTPAGSPPKKATAVPRTAPCPPSLDGGAGHCLVGQRCPYPLGFCQCDGYHGGTPPPPDVDYSHWRCGKTRDRSDGCPDDLVEGAPCSHAGQRCDVAQGMPCRQPFLCDAGAWTSKGQACPPVP